MTYSEFKLYYPIILDNLAKHISILCLHSSRFILDDNVIETITVTNPSNEGYDDDFLINADDTLRVL